MQPVTKEIKQFGGLRNDEDSKQIGFEYFVKATNYNYPDDGLLGLQAILAPSRTIEMVTNKNVDGIYEYRYLSSGGSLTTENIVVCNGTIYKSNLTTTNTALKTGLSTGKISFATFNDKLFIANGLNYVNVYNGSLGVVSEMGAPWAVGTATGGNVDVGAHYYAITYVTAAGEEVLGSVSNTVTIASTAKQVNLTFPLGYSGTVSRNIYRTLAGGTTLKLLDSIANNTATTYTDNIADATITGNATIPATNNELPKPYILTVAKQKLYGCKVTKYPTQLFATEENLEVWDAATFIDVANYGNDNTALEGIGVDFGKVLVGTGVNWYIVDPSDTVIGATTVIPTRANVGCKSGYSVKQVPANGDFPGGLVFVSTLNDVRVMSGLQELPVSTSIDNVRTENWAQVIRGSLSSALTNPTNIYAEFYKYKYHLVIDGYKYVFDIRIGANKGWTFHDVKTASYSSRPLVLGVLNNILYNGQANGYVEQEYASITYRSEDVQKYLESPDIESSKWYKFLNTIVLWFKLGATANATLSITTDSNTYYTDSASFNLVGGYFDSTYFNSTYFSTSANAGLDYRTFNVNKPCRWFKYSLLTSSGITNLQSVGLIGQLISNKE